MRSNSAKILIQGIAASALAVAACAGVAGRQAQPVTAGAPAPGPDAADTAAEAQPMVYDPRLDEIRDRDKEIRDFRRDLGLAADPTTADRENWMLLPLSKAKDVCPVHAYPQTPKCKDVCNLADHICENADAICDLAKDLGAHEWAQDKCAGAKASCKDGKKRCCDCNGDEPHEDEGEGEAEESSD